MTQDNNTEAYAGWKFLMYFLPLIFSFSLFILGKDGNVFGLPPHYISLVCVLSWGGVILSGAGYLYLAFSDAKKTYLLEQENKNQKMNVEDLEKEIESLRSKDALITGHLKELLAGYLQNLATGPLDFDEPSISKDRISLYSHDKTSDHFLLLARYSNDPELQKLQGRKYPRAQGCIGKAWTDGCFEITCLPAATNSKGKAAYIKASKKYNVPEEIAESLKMKSRYYFGYRIMDPMQKNALAVIVVESLRANRYTKKGLTDFFSPKSKHSYGSFLSEMLYSLQGHLPTPPEGEKVEEWGLQNGKA